MNKVRPSVQKHPIGKFSQSEKRKMVKDYIAAAKPKRREMCSIMDLTMHELSNKISKWKIKQGVLD